MAKKNTKKRNIIIFIVILIVFGGIFLGVFLTRNNQAIAVTISKAERRTIEQTVSAIGKIEPETEVKISSETSGEVIFVGVKEGDTVKEGRLLIKIKPDIVETQLDQFRSAAEATKMEIDATLSEKERAKNELARVIELYKKEFASKQEMDQAKSNFEKAESNYGASLKRYQQSLATLSQFQKTAARTTIYSPIAGIVTKLDIEKGEKVVGTAQMAGTEMMRISDLSVMNAMVDVDENDIVLVKVGDTANIEIDALPNKIYKGIVIEMGHSAIVNSLGTQDQVTNFKVKIRLIDIEAQLRPGMSCNVEIRTDKKTGVLAVPLQSVTIRDTAETNKSGKDEHSIQKKDAKDDKQKIKKPPSVVFIKNGDKVKMVTVKTGISDKGFIEILEGLKDGNEIVSGSYMAISKQLKDGSEIKLDSLSKKKANK